MRPALGVWLGLVSLLVLLPLGSQAKELERYRLFAKQGEPQLGWLEWWGAGETVSVLRQRDGEVLFGVGRRCGNSIRVAFVRSHGLRGALNGVEGSAVVHARYQLHDEDRLSGLLWEAGSWRWQRELGRLDRASPVYALAPVDAARDGTQEIDLLAHNAPVSAFLRARRGEAAQLEYPLIVVPGYATQRQRVPLSRVARRRLELAAKAFKETGALAILLSGGNVHPADTPFNEALEMKRALIAEHGIPAERIALDPYARHSTTNLRNAGRFLLSHGLQRALVVTSGLQSFYFSVPDLSTFQRRCRRELGYRVGVLRWIGPQRTHFEPSARVFTRGDDPLDP